MIGVLGAVFVLLVGVALVFRRDLLPWILSAAVPFSATAGFTVAGQSIVIYHVVAVVVVAVAVHRHRLRGILSADMAAKPGLRPLLAFAAWTIAVTALAPSVFSGIPVLDPRDGIDDGVKAPALLAPSLSNLAQSGYLVIGLATVIALGSMRTVTSRVPTAGFAVGTVLSSARDLLPASAQKTLFDNSANVAYTAGEFDGVERMRGIFSEPSALGAFSVAAVVFFLLSASRSPSVARRAGLLLLGAWALTNAVLSFSGGALVSGLLVLAAVVGQRVYAYVRGRLPLSSPGLVAVLMTGVVVVVAAPAGSAFVVAMLTDKTGSSSYENRNAADAMSYSVLEQTLGLGAGVGSNRPSSFVASILSTTGVIGALLFASAMVLIVARAARSSRYEPVVAALIAVVASKVVAGPDVSDPVLWFLLGVCASASWNAGAEVHADTARERAPAAPGDLIETMSATRSDGRRPG